MEKLEPKIEDRSESPKAVLRLDIDPERQFVIRQKENSAGPAESFAIEKADGEKVFDFRRLAESPEISFGFKENAFSNTLRHYVLIGDKDISHPRDIFVILHELAHANLNFSDPEEYSRQGEARKRLLLGAVTPDQRRSFLKMITRRERDVWAEAVRCARTIKKESGVDLFRLFGGKKEFMGWLRQAGLNSYERELHRLGGPAPTKPEAMAEWKRKEEELLKDSSELLQKSLEDADRDLSERE